jgi:hypothetical protein
MSNKEKYIAKTKGGTDTKGFIGAGEGRTWDSRLLKLMKRLGRHTGSSAKLKRYKQLEDALKERMKDVKMLKKTKGGRPIVKKNKGGLMVAPKRAKRGY